jgi:hypothetical protein
MGRMNGHWNSWKPAFSERLSNRFARRTYLRPPQWDAFAYGDDVPKEDESGTNARPYRYHKRRGVARLPTCFFSRIFTVYMYDYKCAGGIPPGPVEWENSSRIVCIKCAIRTQGATRSERKYRIRVAPPFFSRHPVYSRHPREGRLRTICHKHTFRILNLRILNISNSKTFFFYPRENSTTMKWKQTSYYKCMHVNVKHH